MKASELAGFADMPCIVRNLTDEQAITQMVEDNTTQRESILPSERANLCRVLHGVDVCTQAERDAFAQRRGQHEHRRQCRRCQPPHQPHSSASAGTICFFRLTTFGSHTW